MDKDTSEIAKLTERISKDPKSKLFVPLAEEYKKAGDLEMSIHVLTEGLKNNPGYVTARSFLGKLLIEKGDLPAAQKEFEEVVKVIPDNLMAQRRLGDLYALQDRPADALTHYKTALSLNPSDKETASLVSDVEAGHDIKARLSRPKPQGAEVTQGQKPVQVVPIPAAPAGATGAAAKPQLSADETKPAASVPPTRAAAAEEEPEEVLAVEPLEPEDAVSLEDALSAGNLGFLAEKAPEPLPAVEDEKTDALFDLSKPFDLQEATGEAQGLEETELRKEEPGAVSREEPGKQTDDFTTDTLAELYISQGFFEKAVDIYERMLVDNPNSQGLKDKLAAVRAMAAQTAPAPGTREEAKPSFIPVLSAQEPHPDDMPAAGLPSGLDEYVPPTQEIAQLPPVDWNMPIEPAPSLDKEHASPSTREPRQPRHFEVGFEPVEYVPPDAAPRQDSGENTDKTPGEQNASPRKSASIDRKQTIDRLENWLQNIMKEK